MVGKRVRVCANLIMYERVVGECECVETYVWPKYWLLSLGWNWIWNCESRRIRERSERKRK